MKLLERQGSVQINDGSRGELPCQHQTNFMNYQNNLLQNPQQLRVFAAKLLQETDYFP